MARGNNQALIHYLTAAVQPGRTPQETKMLMDAARSEALAALTRDNTLSTEGGRGIIRHSGDGSVEKKGS